MGLDLEKANKVIQLTEVEHVLLRSARYLGGTAKSLNTRFCLEDSNIVFKTLEYVPALLKLIREIVDNSIDEGIRTGFKYANKIIITISNDTISVEDNGRGIPVINAEDSSGNKLDKLMPELAWTELRAGSNFDDDEDNTSIGQNGEGSSLVAIWSKSFIGETSDGNLYCKVECKDNLSSINVSTKNSKKKFTKVTFKPDLERLGLESINDVYKDLIEFDLMFLKETFPLISFEFKRI